MKPLTLLQNELKAPIRHDIPKVVITDREMAMYRYTALKMAYLAGEADKVLTEIRSKEERRIRRFNRSICAAMVLAILGLVIKHVL